MRALLLAAAVLLAGCSAPSDSDDADVLATFYPLAWVTERLATPNISVGTLVPSGIEPHDWEPVASDVARLADARLVVTQGAGFEPWLDGILGNLGQRAPAVVDTTASLELAEGDEEEGGDGPHYDPHTWLDPTLLAQQARAIERPLATEFPEEAIGIGTNAASVAEELEALAEEYREGLGDCEIRTIIANHDAYSYLASRFEFEVVSISGLSPEAEPSPDAIGRAVEVAREHNITLIFFEELVSPRVAQVVAREVGAQTRVLSPIESAPAQGDYLSLMRENLVGLREAMRCT